MAKTVLITGANSGIGRAIAYFFDAQGFNVIATARNPESLVDLSDLSNPLLLELDVTNPQSIEDAIKTASLNYDSIDVLINNAGYGAVGAFEDFSETDIEAMFNTMVYGPMRLTKAVLPLMKQQKSGVIVNISSLGGLIGFPYSSLYNSVKFALEGFSESVQYELAKFGIRVKLIEPGGVKTNFLETMLDYSMSDNSEYKEDVDQILMKFKAMEEHLLDPVEVAEVIYGAVMDEDSEQLRFVVGDDTEHMIRIKHEGNEKGFFSMIKESFLKVE